MTLDDVRLECAELGVGEKLWSLLLNVCRRVASHRRYEVVRVYNGGIEWSPEAFEELAQDVLLEQLLPNDQEQLAEILVRANSIGHLEGLLGFHTKRVLNRRRGVHTADRLLDRVRKLAETDSYAVWSTPAGEWIAAERVDDARPLTPSDINEAISLVADIPRLPMPKSGSRESMVYSTPSLRVFVGRLIGRFGAVDWRSLREIFEKFLTPRFPAGLQDDEEISDHRDLPEDAVVWDEVQERIREAANAIDATHRRILVAKMHRVSDKDLAQEIGRSRPWIAQEGKRVLADVQSLIGGLPGELQHDAAGLLFEMLVTLEEEATQ